MDDLLNDFLAETAEILAEAGGAIVAWEADPADRAQLDAIFRLVHTIKGSSGFLALPRVTALSHAAEDALDQVRRGNRPANATLVTGVLGILDRLGDLCTALSQNGVEPAGDDRDVIGALAGDIPEDAPFEVAGVPLRRDDDFSAELQSWRSIRVPLPLLDSVMTGVTDIVLARNEFARMLRESGADLSVIASFDRLSDSIAGMRQSVSQMRMQRIDKLFAPLPRIVRDLAKDMGKKIAFQTSGGEVELDREMMENIRDPLIHIVRNAIDHGIEPLEDRVAAGKDITATISVSARQSGNQIEIEVRDDGRGLSPDALTAKAIASRLLTATEARALAPKDKLDLIFRPGFSTAAKITSVSGRGVGMDIVKANVEKIGGIVELRNEEGRGLAILLRVPMTLTIISGLMVRAAGQYFAIPRGAVREILLENGDTVRIDQLGGGELATVRGEQFPLLRLENILGRERDEADDSDDRALVIVRPGQGQSYALSVAAIHDHEELVIKPAAPMIMATGLYAGTTLPDNGRPVLLLDVQGLLATAAIDASETGRSHDRMAEAEAEAAAARNAVQLLLFRDMNNRVRGVRLSVIERVEEVPAKALFESAGRVQAQIGDDIFPVHASALPGGEGTLKLLRLYDGRSVLCYPIAEVIDIVRLPDAVQPSAAPGLIAGVVLVGGDPVELIDPFWLMEQYAAGAPALRRPLCRLADDHDGWGGNFLAPILRNAGYRVVMVGDASDEAPDVLLCLTEEGEPCGHVDGDVPVIRLRTSIAAAGPEDATVYRYDRQALLDALRRQVGGESA
ncbi:chemotaxis protein CheA [Sphingopyxis sp. H038]|nr:chemotaxis protein CheA [Sphingopyxis sp. H012]KTE13682.1 chemotaxis protein CheA [Sphingopyxis sp. H053]KTE14548.1 chemotaxis protein CheA [Sphingopyxis sp. H093]KTE31317.1 chemotaxis protein CheA [Sphingopyxis sp. H080]KTE37224.1 chemotaxis protein CheA [Sphingopyxis sp. H038]KTE42586.1 chemotaxis protein CheA [Sphingopyxis sp. H077]KTE47394.1 chemotaxis protein CheA [Sphingopyxis sp. H005]KTE71572.1 chemotaxis protein CheA [Sphingopyxis sp. H085]